MKLFSPDFRPGDKVLVKLLDGAVITTVKQCFWSDVNGIWFYEVEGNSRELRKEELTLFVIQGVGIRFEI